jgi:stage V sporulation protein R
MVESMTATAERIANYEMIHGKEEVERFLDAVLAIQEHVDPSIIRPQQQEKELDEEDMKVETVRKTPYDDLWNMNQKPPEEKKVISQKGKKIPQNQEKDLLLFILEYSRELEEWQRDILTMMREEMLYFWPQLETKIMNEGWASFWHQRILREMNLSTDDTIEFATLNANVIQPSKTTINPYYLGLKIYEDIEERYNHPTENMKRLGIKPNTGREKIFEVREIESDISFIRNYVTKELVQKEDLYLFEKKGNNYEITNKDYEDVRNQLVSMRVNGGFPYIVVENGDYLRNGELYLVHKYEGTELDLKYLESVLPYIYQLWGRIVHLETYVENLQVVYSFDKNKVYRRYV